FLMASIPIVMGITNLVILKRLNQLYSGATTFMGGFDDLLRSSISFPEHYGMIILSIKYIISLSLLVGVVFIVIKKKFNVAFFYVTTIMTLLVIGILLEHFLFGSKFPYGRSTLFYLPIIALYIYYLLLELINTYSIKKRVCVPIILCLIAPLYLNFFTGVNFTHATTWRYDAHPKEAMGIVKSYTEDEAYKATITNHWLTPAINYYISTWDLNLYPATRNGVDPRANFIYHHNKFDTPDNFEEIFSPEEPRARLLMKRGTNRVE
ncbi:MAG: hypothetical protein ACJA01_002496, partial [Saprospiraceae bacterium]